MLISIGWKKWAYFRDQDNGWLLNMKVTVDILDEKNWLISITRWENYGLNYVGSWYPGCWLTLVTGMDIFPARSTALGAGPIKRATHLIFQTVPYTGLLTAISISSWCTLYNIHGHIYKAVTPASIVSKFSILHTQVIHLPIQLTKIKYIVEMKSCAFTLVTLCPLPSNDTAQQTRTIGLRTNPVLRMKLWFTLRATGLTTSRSIFVRWTSWKRSNSIRWFIRHLDTVDFLFYRVSNLDGCFVSYHMNIIRL